MSSDAQKNKGWLLPDPIDGYELTCVTFQIPDAQEYRTAADGAIRELTKWWNWSKSYEAGDRQATDAATLLRNILFETLMIGECPVYITAIRIEDCQLQVQFNGGEEWLDMGDISACGAVGPQGPAGQDGQDGQDGVDGQDGQDGVDGQNGQDGATGPKGDKGDKGDRGSDGADGGRGPDDTTTPTTDTNLHLCAVSQGLAEWTCDKFHSSIELLRASVDLGRGLLDQATDLMDALPVIGALLNNVFDFIETLSTAGDFDDILGFIDDPDYRLQFACQIYCVLKENSQTDFTKQNVLDAMNAASIWNVHLPLGLPLLTAYGPAMGLFIQVLDYSAIFRTAVIHLDETSDDCELACEDCADEPETSPFHIPDCAADTIDHPHCPSELGTLSGVEWLSEHVSDQYEVDLIAAVTDETHEGKEIRIYAAWTGDGDYGHVQWNWRSPPTKVQFHGTASAVWEDPSVSFNNSLPLDGTETIILTTTNLAAQDYDAIQFTMNSYSVFKITRVEFFTP